MKHTPGPWQVGGQFPNSTFVNAGRNCIAMCDDGTPLTNLLPHAANARLIAAAPDLLAAAIEAEAYITIARASLAADRQEAIESVLPHLRAAIKAATPSESGGSNG